MRGSVVQPRYRRLNFFRNLIRRVRPWAHRINVKERKYPFAVVWLSQHAPSGWRSVGYVEPKPEEIERRYIFDGTERRLVALPDAFVGIEFKSEAEAVMFKMILNDL